jgi:hypothetical protein
LDDIDSQSRLGDVKKRLDAKLSELMNNQIPSSTKLVSEQQVPALSTCFLVFLHQTVSDVSIRLPMPSCSTIFEFACTTWALRDHPPICLLSRLTQAKLALPLPFWTTSPRSFRCGFYDFLANEQ